LCKNQRLYHHISHQIPLNPIESPSYIPLKHHVLCVKPEVFTIQNSGIHHFLIFLAMILCQEYERSGAAMGWSENTNKKWSFWVHWSSKNQRFSAVGYTLYTIDLTEFEYFINVHSIQIPSL
jgi:hypothetical protein